MTVLLTGAAGFIGFHVAKALLDAGHRVVGVDTLTDDYDPCLKRARLLGLTREARFRNHRVDILDQPALAALFASARPTAVVHLAARAGVRASVREPASYTETNALGFARVVELASDHGVERVLYASSSSVYGDAAPRPTPESAACTKPLSPYAATKLANELLANSIATNRFRLLGLRFFTAYGPWGRPDMASHFFLEALRRGTLIQLNNDGDMGRDWVYVGDIARVVSFALRTDLERSEVWNVGSGKCTPLGAFVRALERCTGHTAECRPAPLPAGDVPFTQADLTLLRARGAPTPDTPLEDGLNAFVRWHEGYYGDP